MFFPHTQTGSDARPKRMVRINYGAAKVKKGPSGLFAVQGYNRGVDQQAEARLARALLAGEAGAFEKFVEHFRSKVFHYSWLMCGRPEDAEEVAQETLFKVFENLDQLRDPERVRPWVFRIAKNVCLMQRRKSVFAPARELSLDELPPASEMADASPQPEGELLGAELRAVLDRAIADLPVTYRAVVLLRDTEEL